MKNILLILVAVGFILGACAQGDVQSGAATDAYSEQKDKAANLEAQGQKNFDDSP